MDYSWENHAPVASNCCNCNSVEKNYIGDAGNYICLSIKILSRYIVWRKDLAKIVSFLYLSSNIKPFKDWPAIAPPSIS